MMLESTAVQNWQIYQCVGPNRSFKKIYGKWNTHFSCSKGQNTLNL